MRRRPDQRARGDGAQRDAGRDRRIPGFEYTFDLEDPPEGRSRFFVLFDGKIEYTLNCQSTPDKRDELQAACRQAVDTLAKTGD